MSAFTEFTSYERVVGTRKLYQLTDVLPWWGGKENGLGPVQIPEGTTFDISVPRVLECVLSPHDPEVLTASAIHDYFLNNGYDAPFAAGEFRRACRALGSSRFKAWALFYAVLIWTTVLAPIVGKFK